MEKVKKQSQIGGISIISFVVIVTISLSYYQFVYTPAINAKPDVAEEILNPSGTTDISIVEGSSLPTNPNFFLQLRYVHHWDFQTKLFGPIMM